MWDQRDLAEVAWIVESFVNQSKEVIESDPLKDWLDEYRFYITDGR